MVKFIPVNPHELDNIRDGRRGRVSYPILKSFLETGYVLVQFDRTGVQQSMQSLTSSLNAYIKSHDLPVRIFQRRGQLYLARTDVKEIIENGKKKIVLLEQDEAKAIMDAQANEAPEDFPAIDEDEIQRRYEQEKGQVTK